MHQLADVEEAKVSVKEKAAKEKVEMKLNLLVKVKAAKEKVTKAAHRQ
jgi:hypothetical protein